MAPRRGRPTQSWITFLRNHAGAIAAIDLFTVPTLTLSRLYAFVVLGHRRRTILHVEVAASPTALWLAAQLRAAFDGDTHALHSDYQACVPPCHACVSPLAPTILMIASTGARFATRSAPWVSMTDRHRSLAVAERVCRAADRRDSARMPRSRDHRERRAPAPRAACLCQLLQFRPHTSGIGKGRPAWTARRSRRTHRLTTRARRPASALWAKTVTKRGFRKRQRLKEADPTSLGRPLLTLLPLHFTPAANGGTANAR